jgi:hypothetical protein
VPNTRLKTCARRNDVMIGTRVSPRVYRGRIVVITDGQVIYEHAWRRLWRSGRESLTSSRNFHQPRCCLLAILVALGVPGVMVSTFFLSRALSRWVRTYTLAWPPDLNADEQVRICQKHFNRHGVLAWPAPAELLPFNLVLCNSCNYVLVAIRSSQFQVADAYLQELVYVHLSKRPTYLPVLVLQDDLGPVVIGQARRFEIPVLMRTQLGNLRALMNSKPADLRKSLFEISPAFAGAKLPDSLTPIIGSRSGSNSQ